MKPTSPKPLNLDSIDLSAWTMLVYGPYGGGKTYLGGSFLRPVESSLYVNVAGEDGYATLALFSPRPRAITVESWAEWQALQFPQVDRLVIDSLSALYRLQLIAHLGELRYPDPQRDGERARMLWGQLKLGLAGAVAKSRSLGKRVLWLAPYDRSDDPTSGGRGLTPDLPGALAWGCGGWFNFVGLLRVESTSQGGVRRIVSFAPSAAALTRIRGLTQEIYAPITLPEGPSCWDAVESAMLRALPKT